MDWDCKDTEYFLICNFLSENFHRIFVVRGTIGREAAGNIGRKAEDGIGRKAG